MSTSLDLINAIAAGDSEGIETHFDNLMTARIAEKLDDKRMEVAKNMFKEDLDEEKKLLMMKSKLPANKENMKDGKKKRVLSYSTNKNSMNKNYFMIKNVDEEFEDFTPEEIEEFMQTEEFERLDEISKDTLRSYLDKSMNSYADDGAILKDKQKKGEDTTKIKSKIKNRLSGQMKAYTKLKA
jgi:hypothetical protein